MKLPRLSLALFVVAGPLAFLAAAQSSASSTSSGMGAVTRVTKDSLRDQLTAKNLLGKDVYDNRGKKIGSVHDVVLADQHSSLGTAMSGSSSDMDGSGSSTGTSGSAYNSGTSGSGNTTAGSYGTTSAGNSSSGNTTASGGTGMYGNSGSGNYTSGNTGTSSTGNRTSSGRNYDSGSLTSSGMMTESALIISTGHFGMGGAMLRVPISQVNYDSSQRRLTLNLSEDDLDRLKDSTPASSSSNG